jgi:hypothetical protein
VSSQGGQGTPPLPPLAVAHRLEMGSQTLRELWHYSRDGTPVLLALKRTGYIEVHDGVSGGLLGSLGAAFVRTCAYTTADGQPRIAALSIWGVLSIWSGEDFRLIHRGKTDGNMTVGFCACQGQGQGADPGPPRLILGDRLKGVQVWDGESGALIGVGELDGAQPGPRFVTVLIIDGRPSVLQVFQRAFEIIDPETQEVLVTVHDTTVRRVAWCPQRQGAFRLSLPCFPPLVYAFIRVSAADPSAFLVRFPPF